jgi:hypothetical protein
MMAMHVAHVIGLPSSCQVHCEGAGLAGMASRPAPSSSCMRSTVQHSVVQQLCHITSCRQAAHTSFLRVRGAEKDFAHAWHSLWVLQVAQELPGEWWWCGVGWCGQQTDCIYLLRAQYSTNATTVQHAYFSRGEREGKNMQVVLSPPSRRGAHRFSVRRHTNQ